MIYIALFVNCVNLMFMVLHFYLYKVQFTTELKHHQAQSIIIFMTLIVFIICQETESQQQFSSEDIERTESGEYQSAGALASGQKNAWQMQKHVIQRKFMEVCYNSFKICVSYHQIIICTTHTCIWAYRLPLTYPHKVI